MTTAQKNLIERVTITPEMAGEMLAHNVHNRHLRQRTVAAYAIDMTEGNWMWNGDSIKFAINGALLDGQHRLQAIIEADVAIDMLVVRGLPSETQDTVDGGLKRKFSDVLNLHGETNAAQLAAIVRRVGLWELGLRTVMSVALTNAQLLQILEKYPDLRQTTTEAIRVARGCALRPGTVGLCIWLFEQIDAADSEQFFGRLADGVNLGSGSSIYVLRKTAEGLYTVRGARSEVYMTAITIKAWNAYRDGANIGLLRFKPGGASPEKYPEPR